MAPLGDLPVNMPINLYDKSSGEQWPMGETVMPGSVAARAVTAVDPQIDDWLFEPGRAAIWQAVAEAGRRRHRFGGAVASDADLPRPADLDTFLDRLFAGPVQYRALSIKPLDEERIAEELPVELERGLRRRIEGRRRRARPGRDLDRDGSGRAGAGRGAAGGAELPCRDGLHRR